MSGDLNDVKIVIFMFVFVSAFIVGHGFGILQKIINTVFDIISKKFEE